MSGNLGSIRFRSQGRSTDGDGTLFDGHPVSSMDPYGGTSGELGIGVENEVEEVSL